MATTQAKNPALYRLDKQPYESGCIFNHLIDMDYERVVSLDIGHGECVAYQYLINHAGDWVADRLMLNANEEYSVPSYITYIPNTQADSSEAADAQPRNHRTEDPIIGHEAAELTTKLITYFKKAPGQWDSCHENDTHTTRQIMRDFIETLWKSILSKNETLRNVDRDKVLITIGCPASPDWTSAENMNAYCTLIREATGYPHVTIIPESNAAIMSTIYSRLSNSIDLQKGVAMYDLGSSTIDFTFVLMGKAIVTRSIALGGSNIDRALLEIIARENLGDVDEQKKHTIYKTESLPSQEREKAYAQLRTYKEKFFDCGQNPLEEKELKFRMPVRIPIDPRWILSHEDTDPKVLAEKLWDIVCRDFGKNEKKKYIESIAAAIQQVQQTHRETELTIHPSTVLSYTMDKALMHQALTTIHWEKLPHPYTDKSWYEAVKRFFENTRSLIQEYGCGCVILTGGTSKVACVREIAEACYGKGCVLNEVDTSVSVARGMCHTTGKQVDAAKRLPGIRKALEKVQKDQFRIFCNSVASYRLFDLFWGVCMNAAKTLNDGESHTTAELIAALEAQTNENPEFIQKLHSAVQDYAKIFWKQCIRYNSCPQKEPTKKQQCNGCDISQSCSETIRRTVNDLSAQVYKAQVTALPALPHDLIEAMAYSIEQDSISSMILKLRPAQIMISVMVNISLPVNGNGGMLVKAINGVAKAVIKHRKNNPNNVLTPKDCARILEALDSKKIKDDQRNTFIYRLSTSLQESTEFAKAFQTLLDNQLEIALGIVLFQLFQETDIS